MTLVRNNMNAREKTKYMEEADYLVAQVTIRERALDIVNYFCPNDKKLSLDTIHTKENNFLMVGDFNSHSQSWGYSTMDKRGENIEDWQDAHHLIQIPSTPVDGT